MILSSLKKTRKTKVNCSVYTLYSCIFADKLSNRVTVDADAGAPYAAYAQGSVSAQPGLVAGDGADFARDSGGNVHPVYDSRRGSRHDAASGRVLPVAVRHACGLHAADDNP